MKNKFLFRGLVLGIDGKYSEYVEGGIVYDEADEEYLIVVIQDNGEAKLYLPKQDSIQQKFVYGQWLKI